ncbi:MAG: alanyl-tRNA editing protein [Pseudomonadota bacterium]
MTEPLYLIDAYLRDAPGTVLSHTAEGGIVLDQSIFYPTSGGQPGDSGVLNWDNNALEIATTIKGEEGQIVLVPAEPQALPPIGTPVSQHIDWDRRYAHMRVHTMLHLLSVVVPLPVTGGSISADKGRLDFLMPEPPEDKLALEAELNAHIARDLSVTEDWITGEELEAKPGLVKTMSVAPPKGARHVRLVRIADGEAQIDLQPCGGTHVARTSEIGEIRFGKVEKKGRENRRIAVHLVR